MNHCLVYSLHWDQVTESYLPGPYVVQLLAGDKLGYLVARATTENIRSYQLKTISSDDILLTVCRELMIPALEEKFSNRKKSRSKIESLLKDDKNGHIIHQYIQRRMATFLEVASKNKSKLCFELKRQVSLEQLRVLYAEQKLFPDLFFKKNEEGIHYRLILKKGDEKIVPFEHDTLILLDHPGLVLVDYVLYEIEGINGNKLKPFLKKEELFIPSRHTRVYFDKFIMDLAGRVDLETEGFVIQMDSELLNVTLLLEEDFLQHIYVGDLQFHYTETNFLYSELTRRRNRLFLDKNDEVTIKQINRSEKEKNYVDLLLHFGLQINQARHFFLPGVLEQFDMVHWLIEHRDELEAHGFKLLPPMWEGHAVNLEKGEITLHLDPGNDWFDVSAVIRVGKFSLTFIQIIEHIRKEDPKCILPDGSIFLIPDVWMTRYSAFAKLGENIGDRVRIKKSQYVLIENESSFDIYGGLVMDEEIIYPSDPNLKAILRPYQIEGVRWLMRHQKNQLGACLADDMGLGKTLQTLALLSYTKNELQKDSSEDAEISTVQLDLFGEKSPQPAFLMSLIIVPASLIFNWLAEIKKFCPHFEVLVFTGAARADKRTALRQSDIVLTTYQTALRAAVDLQDIFWNYIILDESQVIKNRESKIFKIVNEFHTKNRMSLSGTPIENSLADLWSQMQFINPQLLSGFNSFKKHFLIPIEKERDQEALAELKKLVDPYILRRRKEEVARDLPEISEHLEIVTMAEDQERLFEEEKSSARNFLLGISSEKPEFHFHVLRSLMRLRQLSNHPKLLLDDYQGESGKLNQVINDLDVLIKAGHKVLIFSSFTGHLQLVADLLTKDSIGFCRITGETATRDREEEVRRFQEDVDCYVFLLSLKAGGTGLNLTAASYVFILDPWWNPFAEQQAISRAHRIGSKHPVTVIRYISKDSIEEKILRLQERKKWLADELIEDQEIITFSQKELTELLD